MKIKNIMIFTSDSSNGPKSHYIISKYYFIFYEIVQVSVLIMLNSVLVA